MELEQEPPVVKPGQTITSVTDKISSIVLAEHMPLSWAIGLGFSLFLLLVLFASVGYLILAGVGIWGINIPVAWGFAIINFVWWIGIGHAGTLISAMLLLLRQEWRTSINRFAEAMTIFALSSAALFPLIHLGRLWLFYWMVPYPNSMELLPQFRSPLLWDFYAVFTYFAVSLLFWYLGLVPDLATLRDRAQNRLARSIYGFFALGWRGSAVDWLRYENQYFLLAALATPLVISVHSIVGLDFAVSVVPGWHTTISPPFFVVGAVFSGFAMVLLLAIPLRRFFRLEAYITMHHLDNLAKLLLATGLLVTYGYLMEIFHGWYTGSIFEEATVLNRFFGAYAPLYWTMLLANVLVPQLFWFRRARRSLPVLFVVSLIVLIGMWLERFIVVIAALYRDYLPSAWGLFTPTIWDWATLLGSFGLFLTLMFLFVRFLPIISIFEMRELVAEKEDEAQQRVNRF